MRAPASACTVGSSSIHRSQYGTTVLTCVCCSMISEIQMPYESVVFLQGRSRAFTRNHESSAATICELRDSKSISARLILAQLSREPYAGTTVVKPLSSYTCKLTPEQAVALEKYFKEHAYEFRQVPYAKFAATDGKVNAVFYESGKLVVQGRGTEEFIDFVLEPEIL